MKFIAYTLSLGLFLLVGMTSCDKPTTCPDDHLCTFGNTLVFQASSAAAVLTIENPEGAILVNSTVEITDLIPGYPAQFNLSNPEMHFGGAMFEIEPFDLDVKDFLTLKIKFPNGANTDYLGNDYAPDLRMYYIQNGNWSVVNESYCNVESQQVIAKVLRLGVYALAAERDMLEGDFIIPSTNSFGYYSRLVFLHNSKGFREWVTDCDTSLFVENLQLARDSFEWLAFQDSVSITNFTPAMICGNLATVASPDFPTMYYEVDYTNLYLEGLGTFKRKTN